MVRRDRGGFFKSVTIGRSVTGGAPNLSSPYGTKSSEFTPYHSSTRVRFAVAEPTVEYTMAVEEEEKPEVWYSLDDHEKFRDQIDETLNELNELNWDEDKLDDEEYCLRGLEEYFYNETPGYTLADYRKAAVKAVLKTQDQYRMQLATSKQRKNFRKTSRDRSLTPEAIAQEMADTLIQRNEKSYSRARKHASQDREDADFIYGGMADSVEVYSVEVQEAAPKTAAPTKAPPTTTPASTSASTSESTSASSLPQEDISTNIEVSAGRALLEGAETEKRPSQRYKRDSLSYTEEQKQLLLDNIRADLVDDTGLTKAKGRPPI